MEMSNTPIWTTKDKQRIPITEMSDQHLISAHRMMIGQAKTSERIYNEYVLSGVAVDEYDLRQEQVPLKEARKWVLHLNEEMKRRQI